MMVHDSRVIETGVQTRIRDKKSNASEAFCKISGSFYEGLIKARWVMVDYKCRAIAGIWVHIAMEVRTCSFAKSRDGRSDSALRGVLCVIVEDGIFSSDAFLADERVVEGRAAISKRSEGWDVENCCEVVIEFCR